MTINPPTIIDENILEYIFGLNLIQLDSAIAFEIDGRRDTGRKTEIVRHEIIGPANLVEASDTTIEKNNIIISIMTPIVLRVTSSERRYLLFFSMSREDATAELRPTVTVINAYSIDIGNNMMEAIKRDAADCHIKLSIPYFPQSMKVKRLSLQAAPSDIPTTKNFLLILK